MHVCVCMCVLVCVYMCTCVYVYLCICVHICSCVHHMYVCIVYICAYVSIYCLYLCVYICVCVGICICVWMYMHTRLDSMCYNVLGTQLSTGHMAVNKIYPHPFLHGIYSCSEIQFEDLKTNSI